LCFYQLLHKHRERSKKSTWADLTDFCLNIFCGNVNICCVKSRPTAVEIKLIGRLGCLKEKELAT
jgi:hypothetical protein